MKAGRGSKDKGLEFQHEIARDVARTFGWTVEAMTPKSIGRTVAGVSYVSEQDAPDLRIRSSGAPGADIVPLSPRAAAAFPFLVEAKIRDSLPGFWPFLATGHTSEFWRPWLAQACAHCRGGGAASSRLYYPLVACRARLMAPLAVFPLAPEALGQPLPSLFPRALVWPEWGLSWVAVGFPAFLDVLADASCRAVLYAALAAPSAVEPSAPVRAARRGVKGG
jgi:hypothetical protein